ncbi:uncharacterized protein LOC122069989 [Macadamia integrifolia]|uniref:uncharacterized protein LOC122069989 n=1 Tax=Macadamia integrifolia TaxID=60698 RepID=UPI001C500C80|nr:uncharacterized protein LOC122069989 [Macadamia integrifolia]
MYWSGKSIWVEWIYKRFLKKDTIWAVKAISEASWVWRKILKYRNEVEDVIMHIVGNGRSTKLWQDNWHPRGLLIKGFGDRIRYDSGLPHLATVEEILRDGKWHPTSATTLDLREAWGCLQSIHRLHYEKDDLVVWKGDPIGVFTAKSAWEIVRRRGRLVGRKQCGLKDETIIQPQDFPEELNSLVKDDAEFKVYNRM